MNKQVLKLTDISEFYVTAFPGIKILDSFVKFGEKIDVSKFSAFLRHRFYDLGLIGSSDQFLSLARKIRPENLSKLPLKKEPEYEHGIKKKGHQRRN